MHRMGNFLLTLAAFSLCSSTHATPTRADVDPPCKVPNAPSGGYFSYETFQIDRRTQVVEFQATWEKAAGANGYELCWEVLDGRRGSGDTIGRSTCVIHTSTKYTSGAHQVYLYPNPLGRPINVRVRSLHLRKRCAPSNFVYLKKSENGVGNKYYCSQKSITRVERVGVSIEQDVRMGVSQLRSVGNERYIDASVSWVTLGVASEDNSPKEVCVAQIGSWGTNTWVCKILLAKDQRNIFMEDIPLDDAATGLYALVRATNHCSKYSTTLDYGEPVKIPQKPIPFPFRFFNPLELSHTTCLVTVPNETTLRYGPCTSENVVRVVSYPLGTDDVFKTNDGKCVAAVKGKDGNYRAQLKNTCVKGDLFILWTVWKTNSYSLHQKFVRNVGAIVDTQPGNYSPPLCLDFNSKSGSLAVLVECGVESL
eukprot:comp22936_c0_seq1/m.36345 comp22936_c0_seq1/g.36345  ORF comp22936_c0_seq1/g.36345 comp22936_c0_seq1/m.36345 type:complete len:423 (-) comp22936_c0_seq1:711-1979(-)